jgi:hypothetical protein
MLSFDVNTKSPYSGRAKQNTPKEPVTLTCQKNQIFQLKLPFQTPRASGIREFMHSNMLNDDGKKLFIFRKETEWTNVALDASAEDPKTTWLPHATLHKVFLFEHCQDVSKLTVKLGGGFDEVGHIIEREDIEALEFDPLVPTPSASHQPSTSTPSRASWNEAWKDEMESRIQSTNGKLESLDSKMAHLIGIMEQNIARSDTPKEETLCIDVTSAKDEVDAATSTRHVQRRRLKKLADAKDDEEERKFRPDDEDIDSGAGVHPLGIGRRSKARK